MGHDLGTAFVYVDEVTGGGLAAQAANNLARIVGQAADQHRYSGERGDSNLGWGKNTLYPHAVSRKVADEVINKAWSAPYRSNVRYQVNSDHVLIVPVVNEASVVTKTQKVVFDATVEQVQGLRLQRHRKMLFALLKDAGVDDVTLSNVISVKAVKIPAPSKPKLVTVPGKTRTVYRLYEIQKNFYMNEEVAVELSPVFDTLAEAKKGALAHAEKHVASVANVAHVRPFTRVDIRPVLVKEGGGSSVAQVVQYDKAGKVTLEYVTETVKSNPKIDGWIVAFDINS